MAADKISDNVNTKGKIAEFKSVSSKIDFSGDEDWFKVSLKKGNTYEFIARGAGVGAGTLPDPALEAFNASGIPIQSQYEYADALGNAHLIVFATSNDKYFIDAFSDSSSTGSYKLKFDRLDVAGNVLSDGTDTEGKISVGQTKKGHLIIPGDDDWYAINLKADTSYRFQVAGVIPFFTAPDLSLTLRDAQGNAIPGADDSGIFPVVDYTTGSSGGKFFLDVGSSSNFPAYYALTAGFGSVN